MKHLEDARMRSPQMRAREPLVLKVACPHCRKELVESDTLPLQPFLQVMRDQRQLEKQQMRKQRKEEKRRQKEEEGIPQQVEE